MKYGRKIKTNKSGNNIQYKNKKMFGLNIVLLEEHIYTLVSNI